MRAVRVALTMYLAAGVASCAVPVPPGGGPADEDPPTLLVSMPADGAVSQSVDRIVFEFDERIDAASVRQALSITPEFGLPVETVVDGDRLTVRFPEPLRDNTTYIVELDAGLRDAHGVALRQPLTIAFGTGPTLNRGRLRGVVRSARDGRPAQAIDILAYATDPGRSFEEGDLPDYRTQTDDRGTFSLAYLREATYFVLAVEDRNGNRRPNPNERLAAPPDSSLFADSSGAILARPWTLSLIDAEGPLPTSVTALSSRELRVRFSESVALADTSARNWVLADSASGARKPIAFMHAGETSRDAVLRIGPLPDRTHMLHGYGSVADSTGNPMQADTLYFTPSSALFDAMPAFLGFLPDSLEETSSGVYRIWPGTQAGVRFSKPPLDVWDDLVSVSDTLGQPVTYDVRTRDGVRFELLAHAESEAPIVISVSDPDSTARRMFAAAPASASGELAGTLALGDSSEGALSDVVVELWRDDPPRDVVRTTTPDSGGNFVFEGLPDGTRYLVRAYVDADGNARWSPGAIDPWLEPEPIGWSLVEEAVRARWETVLPDTLRIIRR